MKTIRVVAKKEVRYVFRNTKRLLNLNVGDTTYLTPNEIYNMGSLYNWFFAERDETTIVEMFNDDPDVLYEQWKIRNLI